MLDRILADWFDLFFHCLMILVSFVFISALTKLLVYSQSSFVSCICTSVSFFYHYYFVIFTFPILNFFYLHRCLSILDSFPNVWSLFVFVIAYWLSICHYLFDSLENSLICLIYSDILFAFSLVFDLVSFCCFSTLSFIINIW